VHLDDTAARLGVPVEDLDRVHRLAGDRPSIISAASTPRKRGSTKMRRIGTPR
jgi:hypothetical protein